jgi:purine-binding chemotaxis protein CheW
MATGRGAGGVEQLLICRVGSKLCGLPLRHVIETMRPLSLERLANMPPFVSGVSLIRGRPTPVLSARELLGSDETARAGRYVTLKVAGRHVALAVDSIVGLRDVDGTTLSALPPLLRAEQDHAIDAVGRLDAELLVVLEHGKLLDDAQLAALSEARAS